MIRTPMHQDRHALREYIHAFIGHIRQTREYCGGDTQPQLERCGPFGDA
jgi:hypothetical protein